MSDLRGRLYGVGVGPGDAGLLTLKAADIIRRCEYIAVPSERKEDAVSYQIAKKAAPELEQKKCLCVSMPMTKDREVLEKSHKAAAETLRIVLDKGDDVAFLTLGDPTVYSTYIYLHQRLSGLGYDTEIVSGVPSFCAVAALINRGLVNGREQLHILPSSYDIEGFLGLSGTKVLMKTGSRLPAVKKLLREKKANAVMVENCGMENERIYGQIEEMPEQAGYYSVIIVYD